MNRSKVSSVALASMAAVMFSTVAVTASAAEEAKIKCEGANSCKGQSACKTATNACMGQNGCKGKGYLEMTKAECDAVMGKRKGKRNTSTRPSSPTLDVFARAGALSRAAARVEDFAPAIPEQAF